MSRLLALARRYSPLRFPVPDYRDGRRDGLNAARDDLLALRERYRAAADKSYAASLGEGALVHALERLDAIIAEDGTR